MPVALPTPCELDDVLQQAVLNHLLLTYPAWQADDELERSFRAGDDPTCDQDALTRALRDLDADGLVHRRDGFTVPTRAAIRCADLLG